MTVSSAYDRQGLGHNIGFGSSPALVLVDFVVGFNDPEVLGGGNIAAAIENSVPLLAAARAAGVPVVFTRIVYAPGGVDGGAFAVKIPALLRLLDDSPLSQVVPELKPNADEFVLCKTQASCFFDTQLAAWLRWRNVDTVLLAGCTTSGCVRASAVDAASHNFRAAVVSECVGDRELAPHEANLFDIRMKYADVVSLADALSYLARVGARNGLR